MVKYRESKERNAEKDGNTPVDQKADNFTSRYVVANDGVDSTHAKNEKNKEEK